MAWLSDWLRELILVVLMAAFVEMLLPGKSMERYARLVLSLLVLLTMLSPVISLLKGDASSELNLAMEQTQQGGFWSSGGDEGDSLQEILRQGQLLAAGTREESLKLAAGEVAGQMQEQITAATGVRGVNVTVALEVNHGSGGGDVPVISRVAVTLPGADGTSAVQPEEAAIGEAEAAAEEIRIEPVKPVQIQIGEAEAAEAEVREDGAGGNGGAADTAAEEQAESIIQLLSQNWNVERGRIEVKNIGSGAEKS
ncbi:stage III sporulation protein AF [Paenibacillus tengchongensis]|uniref:stage III sporulation protein AF n=1 Tax=Paenibacillus tengchongensis TaxID=2608684 RepID=UPI00124ED231|nr:stage III sporulation protein AF [Paenibacillus tengchongensis]